MDGRVRGSWFISGLGVILGGLFGGYLYTHRYFLQGPIWLLMVGILVVVVLSLSLIFGGYWLSKQEFSAANEWWVSLWVMVGLIGTVALVFWPIFYQGILGNPVKDPLFILLSSAGIGLNAGLISGIYDMRSQRRLTRERNARESLTFVNRLLRHDVRNAVTIIQGRAELLANKNSIDSDSVAAITHQCESITELITEARMLSNIFTEEPDLEPVELTPVIEKQLQTAREVYDDAQIDMDVGADVTVNADSMVNAIVSNLISNGVEHNDAARPQVTISVERNGNAAQLMVDDNGPGLDGTQNQDLFQPSDNGDHGMGMYLVKTLTERYGGEVSTGESDMNGTRVTVELPLAG